MSGLNLFSCKLKQYCFIYFLLLSVLQLSVAHAATDCTTTSWPLWGNFKTQFIEADGRVVAGTAPQFQSFSEGQSYAMVFALVANDPRTFERVWTWTVKNLANNDIGTTLPAWTWGKADDGKWGVLDTNSASDADIWFVYALLEAGRLWHRADYTADANQLLASIEKNSIATLPGFGFMLLPGPMGFVLPPDQWLLNPSYLPIPLLRRLTFNNKNSPWLDITKNSARMISASSAHGFAPNWVRYQALSTRTGKFLIDPEKEDIGSYDAIRVYLWAGMMADHDPLAKPIMQSLMGMEKIIQKNSYPPESIHISTGKSSGMAPPGFSAALIPYLSALKEKALIEQQMERIITLQKTNPQPTYYDSVLSLFGLGWYEQRYHFSANGTLQVHWNLACVE